MERIKVYISDPQVLFREGIHFTLSGEEEFEVIGESTSNEEACSFIESNPPNSAILNIHGSNMSGLEATRRIKHALSSVAIILVTDKKDEEDYFEAIRCGASACIDKDTGPDLLLDTMHVIVQGAQPLLDKIFEPSIASKILAQFERTNLLSEQTGDLLVRLSQKEVEVLEQIAVGSSTEQIITRLNTSDEDIRSRVRLIVGKLVANDQANILIEAFQRVLPSVIYGKRLGQSMDDYVTREEFNKFKDGLIQKLKAFMGEFT